VGWDYQECRHYPAIRLASALAVASVARSRNLFITAAEACASSHHWSREFKALGHSVRLMPPTYMKPYVKRQKNDAADAEAICEAVTRANMRFVETRAPEQQGCLMLHGARHLFSRPNCRCSNSSTVWSWLGTVQMR
jgi:transposase